MVKRNHSSGKTETVEEDSSTNQTENETVELELSSSTFLQKLTGLITTFGVLSIPFYFYNFYNLTYTILTCISITVSVLILENNCRRNKTYNKSMIRPSFMLNEIYISFSDTFDWIGFQFAKLTDLYYWIREYILEDLVNILRPTIKICLSWLEFFKGYYDYYVKQSEYGYWSGFFGIVGIYFLFILLYSCWGFNIVEFKLKSLNKLLN